MIFTPPCCGVFSSVPAPSTCVSLAGGLLWPPEPALAEPTVCRKGQGMNASHMGPTQWLMGTDGPRRQPPLLLGGRAPKLVFSTASQTPSGELCFSCPPREPGGIKHPFLASSLTFLSLSLPDVSQDHIPHKLLTFNLFLNISTCNGRTDTHTHTPHTVGNKFSLLSRGS